MELSGFWEPLPGWVSGSLLYDRLDLNREEFWDGRVLTCGEAV